VLVDQSPATGASLATPPREIRLRFNEAVTPASVRVLDAKGGVVTTDSAAMESESSLVLSLRQNLPAGRYVVSYRVVSADSHPVGGSFVFAVGMPTMTDASAAGAETDASGTSWLALRALSDAILLGGLLIGIGGAVWLARDVEVESRVAGRRRIRIACAVAAGATLASLVAKAAYLTGDPLRGLANHALWHNGGAMGAAAAALVIVAGLALLGVACGATETGIGIGAMVAGIALSLLGLACAGHVATAPPRTLTGPCLAVHVLAAALWIGVLPTLHRKLPATNAAAAIHPFSRTAPILVALLVAAGIVIAVVQVARIDALGSTSYGQLLVLKLLVVLVLLGVAARNKWRLTPRIVRGVPDAQPALRRAIRVELVLAAIIVAITALLGQTPPPRAFAAEAVAATLETVAKSETGDRTASVAMTRTAPGRYRVVIAPHERDGRQSAPLEVTLAVSQAELHIEPASFAAKAIGAGRYAVDDVEMPVPGTWQIVVTALVSEFENVTYATEVMVRP